jgi:CO/xanthine dehydrogenase FAD-binding subunit
MDVPINQVFFPDTFQDLFGAWARFPDAVPFAGGLEFLRFQSLRVPKLPKNILCLDKLEELRRISRTEQYLELGAMVRLGELIRFGKVVPQALALCLEGIAGPEVRNLATIGGHISNPGRHLDASAAMIALDAHYELRTASQARWISASRFSDTADGPPFKTQELLTRIRIPLGEWSYSLYKKFSGSAISATSGVAVLLLQNQKNMLTGLRLVFVGDRVLQDKNSESLLIGKHLPLNRRDVLLFVSQWEAFLDTLPYPRGLLRSSLLNFIESSLLSFT